MGLSDSAGILEILEILENQDDPERVWQKLVQFCTENEQILEDAMTLADAPTTKIVRPEVAIRSYDRSVQVLRDGLPLLAKAHPVLGPAIFAYQRFLGWAFRHYSKKEHVLRVEALSLMSSLFLFHKFNDLQGIGKERRELFAWLHRLILDIEQDIESIEREMLRYRRSLEVNLVSKLIRTAEYERRIELHIHTLKLKLPQLRSISTSYAQIKKHEQTQLEREPKAAELDAAIRKLERTYYILNERLAMESGEMPVTGEKQDSESVLELPGYYDSALELESAYLASYLSLSDASVYTKASSRTRSTDYGVYFRRMAISRETVYSALGRRWEGW